MTSRFVPAPFVQLIQVAEDVIAFRSPAQFVQLDGHDARAVARLWPWLDGARDVEAVATAAKADVEVVRGLLEALVEHGLVTPAGREPAPADVLADVTDPRPLTDKGAAVLGDAALTDTLTVALEDWGLRIVEPDAADLLVAFARVGSTRVFADALTRAHEQGKPVVFAEWRGLTLVVGPTHRRGAACWSCADARAWNNSESPEAHAAERAADGTPSGPIPRAHGAIAAGIIAAEAARALATGAGALKNRQLAFNLWDLAPDVRPVLPVPGCSACAR